jgi:hypothetical protein
MVSRLQLSRLIQKRDDGGPLPGDRCHCEGCTGCMRVYCNKKSDSHVIRYLECAKCHGKPGNNKWPVSIIDDGCRTNT